MFNKIKDFLLEFQFLSETTAWHWSVILILSVHHIFPTTVNITDVKDLFYEITSEQKGMQGFGQKNATRNYIIIDLNRDFFIYICEA